MRSFRCRECGELRETATRTGPLPSTCDVCDPERAMRRRVAALMGLSTYRRRVEEARAAEARVAELEHALAFDAESDKRAGRLLRLGAPGREQLSRAVRQLAVTEGREATREALLDVAAAARAWARVLADTDVEAEAA